MLDVLPNKIFHAQATVRRVLHVGCGYQSAHRLHGTFRSDRGWQEIRLDIDPKVRPDIICSTADLSSAVPSESVDAIWSSHTIEHLYDHEVAAAFAEFRRVLKPDGFLLLRCPDLQAVAEAILKNGIDSVAYESPAGPITPLDMLYGHRPSIEAGNGYMAHHTGFTDARIGRVLLEAGFAEVRTRRTASFDLWVVAFLPFSDVVGDLESIARGGLHFDG